MASLLKKFVDTEQWAAEDIAGRLGMVLHAAFLFAGFQPYGAQPRPGHLLKMQSRKMGGSLCLSRQYTAPDLADREGSDAAVLMLCVQGADIALLVFLTTAGDGDGDDTPEKAYLELLDLGTLSPLLSRSLGGVEPWASRICKSLADGVCWGFLDELCRKNSLPLTGFTSLPDDLKGAILEKLTDGKDLASVECVSSQLRQLVAERDHELWKTLYDALPASHCSGWWHMSVPFFPYAEKYPNKQEDINLGSSWKYKYKHMVQARRRWNPYPTWFRCYFDSSRPIQMNLRRDLSSWPLLFSKGSKKICRILVRRGKSSWPHEYWLFRYPTEEEEMVSMRVDQSGGHRRKHAQNDCGKKKWNGGGAIHSPSSCYRWKHR